jgi:hypothetical protein
MDFTSKKAFISIVTGMRMRSLSWIVDNAPIENYVWIFHDRSRDRIYFQAYSYLGIRVYMKLLTINVLLEQ